MSDPAVVECAAYGISNARARQEEQDRDYETVVPAVRQSDHQPTESSTAVYANLDRDEHVFDEL